MPTLNRNHGARAVGAVNNDGGDGFIPVLDVDVNEVSKLGVVPAQCLEDGIPEDIGLPQPLKDVSDSPNIAQLVILRVDADRAHASGSLRQSHAEMIGKEGVASVQQVYANFAGIHLAK